MLLPLGLGLVWLGVVLTHLPLPYPSDQLNYLNAASIFPRGFASMDAPWQVTRYGLVIPARLATWAFGYSEAGYHLVPLLATGTVLAGTYALGTLLYSRWVGAAAGLVVVTTTPMFEDAAALMPDMTATGLFAVAAALAVAVRQERLPRRWWTLALIGLLLGWSYEVREFILFAWPLIPIVLWWGNRRDAPPGARRWRRLLPLFSFRDAAWLGGALIAVACGELLLGWALYGDPLARVHAIMIQHPNPDVGYAGRSRAAYLAQLPLALNSDPGGVWRTVLLYLVPLGPLVAWRARVPRYGAAAPLIWCVLLWVPMTLEGGLLHPDDPALRLELVRYWFLIFPGLVLGGLGAVWLAVRYATALVSREPGGGRSRRLAGAAAAVVALAGAGATGTAVAGSWRDPTITASANGRAQMAAFRDWMHRHDARYRTTTLWADSRTDSVVEVYRRGPFGGVRWHAPLRTLRADGPGPGPGDLVLLFDMGPQARHACDVCRRAAREALPDGAPRSWRPAFTSGDGLLRVYRVAT